MKRILTPEQEADKKERLVKVFISTIEKTHSTYNYRDKYLRKYSFHRKPNTTTFRVLWKVIDYLYKLRQEAGNPIEWLIEDYTKYMYERSYRIKRTAPYINYFSPTDNNQLGFAEWIEGKEKEIHPDQYWIVGKVNLKKLKEEVDTKIEDINKIQKMKKVPESLDVNIIERGE